MKICKKCGNEFKPKKGLVNYCSLGCRNSRTFSEETKKLKSESAKNSEKVKLENSSRKGLRKIKWIDKTCPVCSKLFENSPSSSQIFCSVQCFYDERNTISIRGGYRKGSGYSNGGWYTGIYCHSSYELVWVIYSLDHNINFNPNKQFFNYTDGSNKTRKYYPDFYLQDEETYVEIKGYFNNNVKRKLDQFPKKIKILYKEDLKVEFDYVINKYGGDFIKLYEGNPHNIRMNKCKVCGKPAKNLYCSRSCSGKRIRRNMAP